MLQNSDWTIYWKWMEDHLTQGSYQFVLCFRPSEAAFASLDLRPYIQNLLCKNSEKFRKFSFSSFDSRSELLERGSSSSWRRRSCCCRRQIPERRTNFPDPEGSPDTAKTLLFCNPELPTETPSRFRKLLIVFLTSTFFSLDQKPFFVCLKLQRECDNVCCWLRWKVLAPDAIQKRGRFINRRNMST